jgi:hypothetical protein
MRRIYGEGLLDGRRDIWLLGEGDIDCGGDFVCEFDELPLRRVACDMAGKRRGVTVIGE